MLDNPDEEERQRRNLTEALAYFIRKTPTAINGIVIGIEGEYAVNGRLMFEIKGQKSFTEAFLDNRRTHADHLPTSA